MSKVFGKLVSLERKEAIVVEADDGDAWRRGKALDQVVMGLALVRAV